MSNTPTLERSPDFTGWIVVNILLFVVALVVFGPLAVVGSLFLYRWMGENKSTSKRLILLGLQCVSTGYLFSVLPGNFPTFSYPGFFKTWLLALLLMPLGASAFGIWRRIAMFLQPKTLTEKLKENQKLLDEREDKLRQQARRAENKIPSQVDGRLRLGTIIKSDIFDKNFGIRRDTGWLVIDEDLLDQHFFILGTTGTGKSETIKRLVYEILENTDRDLFLVDGKGETQLADDVRALAWHFERGNAPIFRLGTIDEGNIYNGFCGAKQDIYNRLAAMTDVQEAEGNATYYANINRNLLQLVCYPPVGAPRSFDEVRERLNLSWLKEAWEERPVELSYLAKRNDRDIDGVLERIIPLMRDFTSCVGPEGFSLEESRCAIFSIRTMSVGDTARRFLQFLIEDIKDFAGKRQQRPGVLIIDEFGAFGNHNVVALLSQARSAKLGVILATQDVSTLGDESTRQQILSTCRTKFLMATDYPQEIAELAGTIYQVESSIQHNEGEATGMGSGRIQHAFKIDMNEAARLRPGEAYVIRQRHAAKLNVARVLNIPTAPEEELAKLQQVIPEETKQEEPKDKKPPAVSKL